MKRRAPKHKGKRNYCRRKMEGGGDIKNVLSYWMEGEINNFIKVWLSVFLSLSCCYVSGKIVSNGARRLLVIFPVVCLFLALPLNLHTIHLGGMTSFFIAWLSNFKLILFAFGKGPLSDPSLSLPKFVAVACLPIKIQQNPSPNTSKKGHKSPLNYAIKIILALLAALARALIGAELEPQFNEPYLSISLQEFWGRRWNLMVTRILRPTIYEPVHNIFTRILGRQWASLPAILCTFITSALMHELIFFYLGGMRPTWEVTWFFVLHGFCLMTEIAVKKELSGRLQPPRIVSIALTLGFVMATGFWLFLPPLLRCKADARSLEELAAVVAFLKDIGRALAMACKTSKAGYIVG